MLCLWTSYVTALIYHLVIVFLITWIYLQGHWPLLETWITLYKMTTGVLFFSDPCKAPLLATLVWHKPCVLALPVEGHTCLTQVFSALSLLFFSPIVVLFQLHLTSSTLYLASNEEHQINK